MAKNDKEFGKWKATILVPRRISIKRYEFGLIIKELGSDIVFRTHYPKGTSRDDMTRAINEYYSNQKKS